MNLRRLLSQAALLMGALAFSIGLQALAAFTQPSTSPPNADAYAPLTTSPTAQSKIGGLLLNTGGATNGLIVQSGNVGIGVSSPSQQLDVAGYVKGSGLCIGGDCKTSWPSGGIQSESDPTVQSWAKTSAGIAVYQCPAGHSDPPDDCANRLTTSPSCTTLVAFHGHRDQITVSCSYVGRLITP